MNNKTSSWQDVFGPNLGYVLEQYDLYVSDANGVDESFQELFAAWGEPRLEGIPNNDELPQQGYSQAYVMTKMKKLYKLLGFETVRIMHVYRKFME